MSDYFDCGAGGTGMQSIAVAVNKGITKHDRIRERELFRFYRPRHATLQHQDSNGSSNLSSAHSPPSSPSHRTEDGEPSPIGNNDVTLAALTQLVALRLSVHRAMINVIGREMQYTLVDATKTMDLVDQNTSQEKGDESWVGSGGSLHKSLSLCENVVALPTDVIEHPFLIVPDLTKHPRFKDRPYVAGPPHYRFYAGTPLRTARGIVIGALCTFAHNPRDLSAAEKAYMATISETIMQHLEMRRAAAERDKVNRMSRGLNAFIEGKASQYRAKTDNKPFTDAMSHLATPLQPPLARNASSDAMDTDTARDTVPEETKHADSRVEAQKQGGGQARAATSELELGVHQGRPLPAADPVDQQSKAAEKPAQVGIEEQFQATLSRAACLLGEALGLANGGGGVAFYDTMSRIDGAGSVASERTSPMESDDMEDWASTSDGAPTPGTFEAVSDSEEARAGVLGSSVDPAWRQPPESSHVQHSGTAPFLSFSSRMVSKFIRRYPSGLVWEFDEHGVIPNQDENIMPLRTPAAVDPLLMQQTAAEREVRQRAEGEYLMRVFPGIRSLVFVPLWDANVSRHYAACFAWTTNALGRFSIDVELSFITAFGNSISAEISRLATIDADQRKSDFIGSVSHELRSPLHGVLASSEFLADTSLDSFQSTLVNTIDSCGRTLLDTINHVLDFSKINSLRRSWKRNRGQHQHQQQRSIDDGGQAGNLQSTGTDGEEAAGVDTGQPGEEATALQNSGIMSILGSTDVAAITEEVVDSIYAGKIYAKAFSPADITDFNASIAQRRSSEQTRWGSDDQIGASSSAAATGGRHGVQVLLDIAPGDYNFVTQPGAIRRIIMNIFGNALKYTDKGSIVVRLCQEPSAGPSTESGSSGRRTQDPSSSSEMNRKDNDGDRNQSSKSKIILIIKDTGKGISTGYLRTRLYTPFAQENDLAPGTGLGLSIVRNIVTMLRGDINIRSKVGRGTEVRITIPNLSRPSTVAQGSISGSNVVSNSERGQVGLKHRSEPIRSTMLDFAYLHDRHENTVVGLYGFGAELGSILQETERIIRRYLREWCQIRSVIDLKPGVRADIVIVDERLLKQYEYSGSARPTDSIIVLCKNPAPLQTPRMMNSQHYFLLKPFGPYKLARMVRKCVERSSHRKGAGGDNSAAEADSTRQDGRPAAFPPALDVSIPRVDAEPTIRAGHSENAGMAILEKRSLSEDSQTQTQLRPVRPRLTSLSPRASPAGSANGDDGQETKQHATGVGGRPEDSTQNVAITDDGDSHTPERLPSPRLQPTAELSAQSTEIDKAQRPPRILVVDDNKTNLMLLQTFLKKKRGLTSDSAMDGGMAVREATSRRYDIIFMDISMPVLNGFEATREIRRHEDMLRKQYRRESLAMPRRRSTSKLWQHRHHHGAGGGSSSGSGIGSAAMTPSHSQQQHTPPTQPLSNGENHGSSQTATAQVVEAGKSGDHQPDAQLISNAADAPQSRPFKPVTPPVGSEDEVDRGERGTRNGEQRQHKTLQQQQQQQQQQQPSPQQYQLFHQHEHKSAFIIALTGLASGRDQSEAFTSGVDLYMTKPVSFKEVGRLLDNWMTNGGLMPSDS